MGNNIAARAMTTPEKTSVRSPGTSSKRYLAIQTPQTVYSARINQTFTSLDSVVELTYDGGAGTLADVLEGMTLFVGSSAGAYDKGIVRVRRVPTSTVFYISETSAVQFADNDYLTVVDLMPPSPRDIVINAGVPLMDFDLVFSDLYAGAPVPLLGPIAAVIELELDASGNYIPYEFTPPDPSESFSAFGATIDSFLFACPGAASTAGLDTTTPVFTIDSPGQYPWSCQITDSEGRTQTGYRWLFANPTQPVFNASDPTGDYNTGNFSFQVEAYSGVDLDSLMERALVVLYERSYYDQQEETLGPIEGYENIVAVGWIEDESLELDPEAGIARFSVQGPAFWLGQIRAFPFGVTDTDSVSDNWTEINELNIDKALTYLLTWYSTAVNVMDCKLPGITHRVQSVIAGAGTLWDQIAFISSSYVFADALCNQYGQLFIQVDSQFMSYADRDNIPVVMDIQRSDIVRGSFSMRRVTVSKKSRVEMAGFAPFDGSLSNPLFSRAPGTSPLPYGALDAPASYIFEDQDDCNFKSGCMLALANNEYPEVELILAQNNPFISIAPLQYVTLTLEDMDTPRGISFTNKRLIPRSVSRRRNEETGEVQTVLIFESEARGPDGITYYPPTAQVDAYNYGVPAISTPDFPALGSWFPSLVGPGVDTDCAAEIGNNFTLNWDRSFLDGGDSETLIGRIYMPCKVRSSALKPTSITLRGVWFTDSRNHYGVYAIKDGIRVLTASITTNLYQNTASFAPGVDTLVDGFEIALESGLGSPVTYTPLDVIASGSAAATDGTGTPVSVVSGQYYCVDAVGGSFDPDGAGPLGDVSACYFNGIAVIQIDTIATGDRYFQQASGSSHNVTVADNIFGDNTGGPVSWQVRNVRADGRRINLSNATIHNVCSPS